MTKALLVLSSVMNSAICFFAFWFMVFATSPTMDDVTMRVGFYVANVISVVALLAVFIPWFFAYRKRNVVATLVAVLPVILSCLAVLAFLTLDSWLSRTFSRSDGATIRVVIDGVAGYVAT